MCIVKWLNSDVEEDGERVGDWIMGGICVFFIEKESKWFFI